MANRLLIKRSSVPGAVPSPADLQPGELAVNTADEVVYFKNKNGVVVPVGGGEKYTKGEVDALLDSTYRDGRVKRFFFMGNQ